MFPSFIERQIHNITRKSPMQNARYGTHRQRQKAKGNISFCIVYYLFLPIGYISPAGVRSTKERKGKWQQKNDFLSEPSKIKFVSYLVVEFLSWCLSCTQQTAQMHMSNLLYFNFSIIGGFLVFRCRSFATHHGAIGNCISV